MDFSYQERNELSDIIENTAASLFNALKYIFAIGENDFYNINAKDIFKVALSDVTNSDILVNLNIDTNGKLGETASMNFTQIKNMIHYAFVIRLPYLKRTMENCPLKESQIKELYTLAVKRGADNYNGIIESDLRSNLKAAKNRQTEPSFDCEWFRRWVYTTGHELAAINNRNMFLFGCADALFPLFYSALTEKLTNTLLKMKNNV